MFGGLEFGQLLCVFMLDCLSEYAMDDGCYEQLLVLHDREAEARA